MEYGKLLASLRKARHISQSDLAEGITSQSALSRYEAGSDIPSQQLIQFLNKLNVHPTEFFMLANDTNFTEQQDFVKRMSSGVTNQVDRDLLVQEQRHLYTQTGNILNLINAVRVETTYALTHDLPLEPYQDDLKSIKEYLLSLDQWLLFEIVLYIDLLFMFDDDFIETYHPRMNRSLQALPFGTEIHQATALTYANNLIILDFQRRHYRLLRDHMNYLQSLVTRDARNLIASIHLHFYETLLQLHTHYDSHLVNHLLSDIAILQKYGYDQYFYNLCDFMSSVLPQTSSLIENFHR